MTRSALLASLLVSIAPIGVRAEEPAAAPATPSIAPAAASAAPSAPAATTHWSLGGGITFGTLGVVGTDTASPLGPLLGRQGIAVPGATGTLERRLSARSCLYVHAWGSVRRDRADVPAGSYGYTRDDARQLTGGVGIRRALTGRGAPVEVSTLVGVHGGVVDGEQHLTSFSTATRTDSTTWFGGASVGLAVQRELTDGLALRVSTPLLHGTYGRSSIRSAGQPTRTSSDVTVSAELTPQLELVAFF